MAVFTVLLASDIAAGALGNPSKAPVAPIQQLYYNPAFQPASKPGKQGPKAPAGRREMRPSQVAAKVTPAGAAEASTSDAQREKANAVASQGSQPASKPGRGASKEPAGRTEMRPSKITAGSAEASTSDTQIAKGNAAPSQGSKVATDRGQGEVQRSVASAEGTSAAGQPKLSKSQKRRLQRKRSAARKREQQSVVA